MPLSALTELYSIFILHQTTTGHTIHVGRFLLYSIFILHQTTTVYLFFSIFNPLYSIFILHQTTTVQGCCVGGYDCILSLFYIKPQLTDLYPDAFVDCILSLFYIKPQQMTNLSFWCRIVFYLYSTSNHNCFHILSILLQIVFYLYSTSNHNLIELKELYEFIVFYLYSTSNHNSSESQSSMTGLYSIFILHQTTTTLVIWNIGDRLYSIFILHQTTTDRYH